MKKSIQMLGIFAGTLAGVMALSVGVAAADHEAPPFVDCNSPGDVAVGDCAPHSAPVGQNLLNPDFAGRSGLPGGPLDTDGVTPGWQGNAAANISRNPNCPAHYAP